ncbi:MAG: hypothetical protein JNK46_12035, partial [Methylobacteriaceae bacterium]|nr:hypothetical protein [Methylobacteriaceae bacterium]
MTVASLLDAGVPTLHARVESWECDFNGHWNTRFYCRAVQWAAEVASVAGSERPFDASARPAPQRCLRFHRELRTGDALEVRSFRAAEIGGANVAHVILHDGRICATALDFGGPTNDVLPLLPDALAPLVGPRGLPDAAVAPWTALPGRDGVVELGRVAPDEWEASGHLTFEASARRLGPAAQHLAARLGFSTDFSLRSGVGRMLVEMRFEQLGTCASNELLRATSRLASVAAKSYVTQHLITTRGGAPLARFDLCLLAVDLATRKATALPAHIAAHAA